MIDRGVVAAAETLRRQFQDAKPFKHLCIDSFLEPDAAEAALCDFPAFKSEYAKNEFGRVGGKAVRMDLASVSAFYARLYAYLGCLEFLDIMSRLTGIADLQHDPKMYGGGTHENLHGQELDPHVDFNIDGPSGMHRRLNLLVYLNKGWREEWGGSIELHSNPRWPDENRVKAFVPIFNRAVVFETNEYSWHGFPVIDLPPAHRHESRKCLSIYLYTRERPEAEIAPPHGTFYVQRPLPQRFSPGRTLSREDIGELNRLLRKRDDWIEFYQHQELRLNDMILHNKWQIARMSASLHAPLCGFVRQSGPTRGLHHDSWLGPLAEFDLHCMRPARRIVIRGHVDAKLPRESTLEVWLDDQLRKTASMNSGSIEIAAEPAAPIAGEVKLTLRTSASFNPKKLGLNEDDRDLAFVLNEVLVED